MKYLVFGIDRFVCTLLIFVLMIIFTVVGIIMKCVGWFWAFKEVDITDGEGFDPIMKKEDWKQLLTFNFGFTRTKDETVN